jgi:hypothetical protein
METSAGSAHNETVPAFRERTMNRRHDRISAMFIDAVLDAGRQHGIARAARLLHEDGVPLDVALRVLTRPGGRRLAPRPPHVLVAAAAALVRPFGSARRWEAPARSTLHV